MNVKYIESIFSSYLALEKTQYALMINGSWGSGKTFFWKKDLVEIAENREFKSVYISLNGIAQIKTLEQHLFLGLIPILGNKNLKFLTKTLSVANEVAGKTSKAFLGVDVSGIFSLITMDSAKLKNTVICFDDFERCQIPLKELLGFVNDFVEHKYAKVLILADESNVDEANGSYDSIKEKVVGRVLNYQPNLEDIFPKLVDGFIGQKKFHSFLIKHSGFIRDVFISSEEDNLRIVSFTLDCLEAVYVHLTKTKETYLKECIFLIALISIEFKRGKLKSSDYLEAKSLNSLNENQYSMWFSTRLQQKEKGEEKPKSYAELFYEKYILEKGFDYHFYFSLYSFVLSGYLEKNRLLEELEARIPEKVSEEVKSYRSLLNYKFRELENEDFARLTTDVLKYAGNGVYGIYDYQQLGNFYNFFCTQKLISEKWEDVNTILLTGLGLAGKREEIVEHLYESLIHFANKNKEVEEIREKIIEVHRYIKKGKDVVLSSHLVSLIKSDQSKEMARFLNDHKFSKEIIQYADADLLFDVLISSTNKMIFDFSQMLKDRYDATNIGEFLSGDFQTMKDLYFYFENYLTKEKHIAGVRKFNLITLTDLLKEIIDKLTIKEKKS